MQACSLFPNATTFSALTVVTSRSRRQVVLEELVHRPYDEALIWHQIMAVLCQLIDMMIKELR